MSLNCTARHLITKLMITFGMIGLVTFVLWIPASLASSSGTFVVIVHPRTAVSELEAPFVAEVFLKKKTRWPDGTLVRPADLKSDNPTRESFSKRVLGRSLSAVRSYWQQRIFSGRELPPPELAEAALVEYVARTEGAIGYASSITKLDGVRAVGVR